MGLQARLRKTFLELIAINEIYPHENEVISYTQKRLDEAGVKYEMDNFRNMIARVEGMGEPIMVSTHFDIPEPAPKINIIERGDIIKADGTSILGADPKSGLAIIIELLIELQKRDPKTHAPVEAVITRGEETGLYGALNLDYSKVRAKMGVILDEDGPVTQVVTQAPAFVRIDAKFIGKIVHPREPEKGVNALQTAAEAMMKIPAGYSTEGVTWNIGKFSAGTARNSVPGSAELIAEMRSYSTELVVNEAKRVEKTWHEVAKKYGAKLEFNSKLEFEGYKLEKNHKLFELLAKTFTNMQLKPNYFKTFGGTDANIFNAHGIMSVPLGSGYYNAHEYTEYINLKEMEEILHFLEKFLAV